ncbi:MAG: diguanylate cyclase [Gemmatimonadales bacterium]
MSHETAKIIVADDDQALLDTVGWILRDKGYEVVPVSRGDQIVETIESEVPDMLMLDVMMPRIDGLQVLERLKSDERWQDLPVLMLSSMPPEDGVVKSLGLGASDFIAKPFRVRELLARIEAHLRIGKQLREARQELRTRSELVEILNEVTDALKPEEIYSILARRVGRALNIAKCSIVIADPEDEMGIVVATFDNPMLRNLEIQLTRYPEIRKAFATKKPVLVSDVKTDPLYAEVRKEWERNGYEVPTRSAIALPFDLRNKPAGVFFLRTTDEMPPLAEADLRFAETVISAAVAAIEKGYEIESVVSDRERFQFLANTDSLTECLNRRALTEKLQNELERAHRYGHHLTLLMIDLDHFKNINDTKGHLVGDSVLRQMGDILRDDARSVDIVARYGGEEFVLVLPDTTMDGAIIFAERLRERIAKRNFSEGDMVPVTVSIGVAEAPEDEVVSVDEILERADAALYKAKNDGRNLVRS